MTNKEAIKAIEWQRKTVSGRIAEALDLALSIMRKHVPNPDTGLIPCTVYLTNLHFDDGDPYGFCVQDGCGTVLSGVYSSAEECRNEWNKEQGYIQSL